MPKLPKIKKPNLLSILNLGILVILNFRHSSKIQRQAMAQILPL